MLPYSPYVALRPLRLNVFAPLIYLFLMYVNIVCCVCICMYDLGERSLHVVVRFISGGIIWGRP